MITSLSEEHPRPGRAGLSQTWALDPTSSWLNGKATVKCSKCMSAMPLYHTCLSSTQTQVLWYNRTSAVIRWAIRELKTITENLPGSAAQHGTNLCRTVWGFLQSLSLNLCWFLELQPLVANVGQKKHFIPQCKSWLLGAVNIAKNKQGGDVTETKHPADSNPLICLYSPKNKEDFISGPRQHLEQAMTMAGDETPFHLG